MSEKKKKNSRLVWLTLLLLIIIMVPSFSPIVFWSHQKSERQQVSGNMRSAMALLMDFDHDFGQFPSDATAVIHYNADGSVSHDLRPFKGAYSNDYLGQLIAAGFIKDEELFYAEHNKKSKVGDNDISSSEKILETGECGFSYLKRQSSSSNARTPILFSNMTGEGLQFDPDTYDGRAVIARVDGAVKQLQININGEAKLPGTTLFEEGEDTVWGVDGFDEAMLVHPE